MLAKKQRELLNAVNHKISAKFSQYPKWVGKETFTSQVLDPSDHQSSPGSMEANHVFEDLLQERGYPFVKLRPFSPTECLSTIRFDLERLGYNLDDSPRMSGDSILDSVQLLSWISQNQVDKKPLGVMMGPLDEFEDKDYSAADILMYLIEETVNIILLVSVSKRLWNAMKKRGSTWGKITTRLDHLKSEELTSISTIDELKEYLHQLQEDHKLNLDPTHMAHKIWPQLKDKGLRSIRNEVENLIIRGDE
jgi:hypothetical protein